MAKKPEHAPGEPFGRYRLTDRIGEGGMAVVYRAVTEGPKGFHRDVVVKRIRADLSRDQSFTSMLLAEARLCALLNHPGIVQVHELGEVEGEYFMAMELVEGHDLSSVILRARSLDAPPPVGVVCFLILQVAEALAYAHTLKDAGGSPLEIVHRDVSPSNIMVTPLGSVKLLDFGVARAIRGANDERTRTGTLKGKIGYLSPEQADGLPIDHRSDLFALGIVFYELLTLQRLFRGDDDLHTLRLIRASDVAPPSQMRTDVGGDVERVVLKMLARDVSQRYGSCQEVVESLQPLVHRLSADHGQLKLWLDSLAPIPPRHLLEDRTTPAVPPHTHLPTVRARPVTARRRWTTAFVVGLVLAIAAGITAGKLRRAAQPPHSVAVLGFKNLSHKPEAAWLSTALAEMLATEMSGGKLRIVPGEEVARARMDVGASDFEKAQPETLQKLRTNLAADVTVDGSYLYMGNQLRVDVRASDQNGRALLSMSEIGSDAQLFSLVARVGSGLRARLGDRGAEGKSRTLLPANPEAARLYAEGLEQLRLLDALSARERLARAAELDPQSAAIFSSLSAAEETLGYESRSLAAAKRAFELSEGLPPAERLSIEGRYRMATRDWPKAIICYRSLFALHPESIDDALQLVHAQVSGERGQDVLSTVNALRKLPGAADDPRVDLLEATAALMVSVPQRALEAAERGIAKGKARGAPLLLARAYLLQGRAQWAMAHAKEAREAFLTADRTFAAAGDGAGREAVLVMLSDLHYAQGDLPAARRTIEEALAISRKLGDKRGEVAALTGLANVVGETTGGDAEAFQIYEKLLALCRSIDDRSCVASQLNNLGGIHQGRRELPQARKLYEESAALLRDAAVGENTQIVLANLSSVLFDLGEVEQARAAAEEALAACKRTGTTGDKSWALYYLGRIDLMQEHFDQAQKRFEEAAQLDALQGKPTEQAAARAALAELLLVQHKLPEAESAARAALALAKTAPATMNLGFGSELQVSEVLMRILLEQRHLPEAARLRDRAHQVVPKNLDPDWAMLLAVSEARLLAAQGNSRGALAILTRELSRAGDYLYHRLWIRLAQVELTHKDAKGLAKEAREHGFELIARRASH